MLNSETARTLSFPHATVAKNWELGPIQTGAHLSDVGSCCPQLKQANTTSSWAAPSRKEAAEASSGSHWLHIEAGHRQQEGRSRVRAHKSTVGSPHLGHLSIWWQNLDPRTTSTRSQHGLWSILCFSENSLIQYFVEASSWLTFISFCDQYLQEKKTL